MQFPVNYSSLSPTALLQMVVAKYQLSSAAVITYLKRGFNDTYLIENGDIKYILRVYKHNWRSVESIETEVRLLNHLKESKISVAFAIADVNNEFIQTIEAPEGIRYAVAFRFAEGEQVRKLSVAQSYLLGVETGKIHNVTKGLSIGVTANNYSIESQFEITLSVLKALLINHQEQWNYLLSLKEEFIVVFNSVGKNELATGVCHGDLQAENFHITNDNQFTFFDFDFFGTGYLVYDIGVFVWYDHKNKSKEIINSFLKGYQTQRKLSDSELKILPYLSTLRALFQMALYCKQNDGQQLPLWQPQQVADFVMKVKKWKEAEVANAKYNL